MPPIAATMGRAARCGSLTSPRTSSRFTSSPTTKKKRAIKPSLIQWCNVWLTRTLPRWKPTSVSQKWRYVAERGELARTSAMAVQASSTMPAAASTCMNRSSGPIRRSIGCSGSRGRRSLAVCMRSPASGGLREGTGASKARGRRCLRRHRRRMPLFSKSGGSGRGRVADMTAHEFTLFDTPIGQCGIAWGAKGLVAVQLPERSERATRARILRLVPGVREAPPPPDVQVVLDGIRALLRGQPVDLSGIALDMSRVPDFDRRVYEVARTIPPGATLSYGEIASRLGDSEGAREVGSALGRNPFAIIVPCHRVVAAGGKLGGFSARGGVTTKLRLLSIEGASLNGTRSLFDRA